MNKAMLCAILPLVIGAAIGQEQPIAASRLYFDRFHGEFSSRSLGRVCQEAEP